MFDWKSKPKTDNFADNNPGEGQRLKKLEEFASDIIRKMRDQRFSYEDSVIICQAVFTGLCAGIVEEKLLTKEELIPWVEDIFGETQKLIQKSV